MRRIIKLFVLVFFVSLYRMSNFNFDFSLTQVARRIQSFFEYGKIFGYRVPLLKEETIQFEHSKKPTKVYYFEFYPKEDYRTGLYVHPLAQGGVRVNRGTGKIEVNPKIRDKVENVLPEGITLEDEGGYVSLPLGKDTFEAMRGLIPDFAGAQHQIYTSQNLTGNIIAILPAGNIGWNDWFIGGVRDQEGKIHLYWPRGENVEDRTYSCIVGFRDGRMNILDLKIDREEENPAIAARIFKVEEGREEDITDKVVWFTFGQKILDGSEDTLPAVAHQFSDLRHLVNFPRIREEEYGGSGKRRLNFGLAEMLKEIEVHGLNNPISEDMLIWKALQGEPVILPTDSINEFLKDLKGHNLNESEIEEVLIKAGYKKAENAQNINPGEFYLLSAQKVKINFKPAPYPHIAIGEKEDGEIIFAFFDGKSGREGPTVKEVAEFMKNKGANQVLLLCNGGDVSLKMNNRSAVLSPANRDNFIGFIYIADVGSDFQSVMEYLKIHAEEIISSEYPGYGYGVIDLKKIAQDTGLAPEVVAEYLRSPYICGDPVIKISGVVRESLGEKIAGAPELLDLTQRLVEKGIKKAGEDLLVKFSAKEIEGAKEKYIKEAKYKEYEFIPLIATDEQGLPILVEKEINGRKVKEPLILKNLAQYDTFLHLQGNWHPTVHVLVIDKNGNVLLQRKRGGKIDIAASGHLGVGEGLQEGAVRELQEEVLHLDVDESRLIEINSYLKIGGGFNLRREEIEDDYANGIYYGPSGTVYNKEVSTLFVYLVDEISQGKKGEIVVKINGTTYRPKPGEGEQLIVKTLRDLGRDINSRIPGYKSTPNQYFRPRTVWREIGDVLRSFGISNVPYWWKRQITVEK